MVCVELRGHCRTEGALLDLRYINYLMVGIAVDPYCGNEPPELPADYIRHSDLIRGHMAPLAGQGSKDLQNGI